MTNARTQTRGRTRAVLLVLCAAVLFICSPLPSATAASFTVATADDSGEGSLRQALTDANANGSGLDSISFLDRATGTIALSSALPAIDTDLELQGPGAALLSVERESGGD